jgi:hypothetical protein
MPVADNSEPHDRPVLNTMQARQGRRGRHALWILVISLGLIVVVYAVMVGGVFGSRLSRPGGQTRANSAALQQSGGFNAPVEAARQTEQSPTVSPSVPPSAGKEQPSGTR